MKIAVVGAGIAGLTCAYELQQAGFDVEVLEKDTRVGGRMLTITNNNLPIDIGANYFNSDVKNIPHYCKQLGVPFLAIKKRPTYIVYKSDIYPTDSLFSLIRYPPVSIRHILKILGVRWRYKRKCKGIYDLSNSPPEFDAPSAAEFAASIDPSLRDHFTDPFVTGLFAYSSKELTASLLINVMCRPFRVYSGKHYHIGTMNNLADAFRAQLSVKKKTVNSIRITKSKKVKLDSDEYDLVVVTCPTKIAYTGSAAQNELAKSVKYSQTIALTYEAPVELIDFFDMIFVPFVENKKIALVINGARKHTHKGKATLGVALHEAYAKTLMEKADTEIYDIIKNELVNVAPFLRGNLGKLKNHALKRWNPALVKYFPKYVSMVRKFWERGQGDNNVYFAGDFMNAPGVEGSIGSGRRVAEIIIKKHLKP